MCLSRILEIPQTLTLQRNVSMSIYLYVKTHNKTGLKYLGKTISKDPHKYPGSGKYWIRHLEKNGYDYSTEILRECQTKEELKYWGLYFSEKFDVVNSKNWANLVQESGDGGFTTSKEDQQKIWNDSLRTNHSEIMKSVWTESRKQTQSNTIKEKWKSMDRSSRFKKMIETKNKIGFGDVGKYIRTEENKIKLKNAALTRKKLLCNHCNKEIDSSNFARWHGDKCKSKRL